MFRNGFVVWRFSFFGGTTQKLCVQMATFKATRSFFFFGGTTQTLLVRMATFLRQQPWEHCCCFIKLQLAIWFFTTIHNASQVNILLHFVIGYHPVRITKWGKITDNKQRRRFVVSLNSVLDDSQRIASRYLASFRDKVPSSTYHKWSKISDDNDVGVLLFIWIRLLTKQPAHHRKSIFCSILW